MRSILLAFALGVGFCSAVCPSPKVTSSHYSTTDAFFHMSSTFIVEFSLECADGAKQLPLYADVEGTLYPVAIAEESNKYQITWNSEHDATRVGQYVVKIYDEDSYSAVRKAQRSNDDSSRVKPLAEIEFNHPGASKGPYFSTETAMFLLSAVIFYMAFSWKSNLMA